MKKTALHKNAWREILNSKARFLSILGIIFLGVAFFSGIKATGPDMLKTAESYYEKQNLSDLTIQGTLGLTKEDAELLEKNAQVKAWQLGYEQDVLIPETNEALRLFAYDQRDKINQFTLTAGTFPKKEQDIVLDEKAQIQGGYRLKDKLTLEKTDGLKNTTYNVVGFVRSPTFIESITRGNTTVGKGSLAYFALTTKSNFTSEAYSSLQVVFKDLPQASYSDSYKEKLATYQAEIKKLFAARPKARLAEIKEAANQKIAEAEKEIAEGEKELAKAKDQLAASKKDLDEGAKKLAAGKENFETEIQKAQDQLNESQEELTAGKEQLAEAEAQLSEKEAELNQGAAQYEKSLAAFQTEEKNWQTLKKQATESITSLESLQTALKSSLTQLETIIKIPDDNLRGEAIQAFLPSLLKTLAANSELGRFDNYHVFVAASEALLAQDTNPDLATASVTALQEFLQEVTTTLEATQAQIQAGDEKMAAGKQQLADAEANLTAGKGQLAQGKSTLATKSQELAAGEVALEKGQAQLAEQKATGESQLAEESEKLAAGKKAYEEGLKTYETKEKENLPKLQAAKEKLVKEQADLEKMATPTYYFFDRTHNPGYEEYSQNAQRITNIAAVFPVLFFFIAALISFTTMTRMVEEKRGKIGTLKALGYGNFAISQKYLLYAGLSAILGSVLGIILGNLLFPNLIYHAYGVMYNLPDLIIQWCPLDLLIAFGVALLCTVGSSMLALKRDLLNVPATLMRPVAPKSGKRLLLERWRFLWSKLGFITKVTLRNLFRFKARAAMTILGIAGCMSLMITGFGLRDSISDIVALQFDKLWHYQAVVTFQEESTAEENAAYEKALAEVSTVKNVMPVASKTLEKKAKGVNQQDVTVYAPKNPEKISEFILFNNRKTGEKYQLAEDGVIINEKLATLFSLKVGDTLTLQDANGQGYNMKISAIAENYTLHFVYMTPTYYKKVFGEAPIFQSEYLQFKEPLTSQEENQVAEKLMAEKKVLNVTFLSETSKMMDDTMGTLNIVVWVLIISAALLAFIVLYNLTNINISERIRELSTIKVLGFYPKEVTLYIYRENLMLTAMGIGLGCLLGVVVHKFVLKTVEIDMMMFGPNIHWPSFIYASLLTLAFTFLVMFFMHRKLKKVDMIEALKSNE